MDQTRDDNLRLASEGKLFINRWISVMNSRTVFYNEDYYVIRNGIVFYIHKDLSERDSGDSVIETLAECECLGDYDLTKIKREKFTYISYKKIRNKFIDKK